MLALSVLLGGFGPGTPAVAAQTDSATAIAGPEYEAGAIHRLLLGSKYRETWTTPVRVPVLDLDRFGGGLTPVQRGGGVQTSSLRFEAPDGREYNFRSVNKSYEHSVPEWARGTLLEWLRQDQTSAQHPAAALIATPLLDAVGILNPGPQLRIMPDDRRLGEFRAEFAGMLGTIELHPNEGEDDEPLFAGSPTIAGGDRVLEHLEEEPEHRLDAPSFLAERLVSIYLGDWDRHIDQYRFARYKRDGVYRWVAIPEDRDYAFVHHDGILLTIARSSLAARLIRFQDRYPSLTAMMSNSPDLVRRLLSPVERATWDSVAHAVHASLTDAAIDRALAATPPEWRGETTHELAQTLRARRARFLEMSERFYRLLAAQAEVHATEEEDVADIERHADGSVTVRVRAPGNEAWGERPYYTRRFVPDETSEIRVFLSEGADRAVVRGTRNDAILVRVVGGPGDDVLVDSSGTGVVFYDAEGDNTIRAGPDTGVDREPYSPPEEEASLLPNKPRDWGSARSVFSPSAAWVSDVGLLLGGGPRWTRYGFRHDPYASRQHLTVLVSPVDWRGAAAYGGIFVPGNSDRRVEVLGRASNVDRLRFHGFGNASPALPDDSALTWHRRYQAAVTWHLPLTGADHLALGAELVYGDPELEDGTRLAQLRPFGAERLGETGIRAGFTRDTRDDPAFPRRGLFTGAELSGHLPLRDSPDPYGKAGALGALYLDLPVPTSPVLALRASGEAVLGRAPVHRAAFLGGRGNLRGFSQDRFAGDAAAHGSAELRVPLMQADLVARGMLGLSGFTDAGRVWSDGASPGGWHTAVGAAAWFNTPLATVAVEYARGEKDALYLRLAIGL